MRAGVQGVVAAALVTSCATSPPSPPEPPPGDSPVAVDESDDLREAMESDVDYDSYLSGFQRFSACLEAEGHTPIVHDADPPIIDYSVPEAAVSSGADERCYVREFAPLDYAWQMANEDYSQWADALGRCLAARGVAPEGTLAGMEEQRAVAGISPEECLVG